MTCRAHHDGDIRADDAAPERGHPLPVVDGSVGVCDGDGGGGGVGEGELVAGNQGDREGGGVLLRERGGGLVRGAGGGV